MYMNSPSLSQCTLSSSCSDSQMCFQKGLSEYKIAAVASLMKIPAELRR